MTDALPTDVVQVREQLQRLKRSPAFAKSASLFGFLAYVVEETLAGRGERLKELVIGDALYGRHTPYDPRIDSAVRVEARRLRRKLMEHYAHFGADDPLRIEIAPGGYHPVFLPPSALPALSSPANDRECGTDLDMAVLPFLALSPDAEFQAFADGLTDEVIYACGRYPGLRVAPRMIVFEYRGRGHAMAEAARTMGVSMVMHGTLRSLGGRSRVTVEMSDARGFVHWSDRLESRAFETLETQEELAQAIVERMSNRFGPAAIGETPLRRSVV